VRINFRLRPLADIRRAEIPSVILADSYQVFHNTQGNIEELGIQKPSVLAKSVLTCNSKIDAVALPVLIGHQSQVAKEFKYEFTH
jgi:hypothetical protein